MTDAASIPPIKVRDKSAFMIYAAHDGVFWGSAYRNFKNDAPGSTKFNQRPIVVLSHADCTADRIRALIQEGSFKRSFTNVDMLENRMYKILKEMDLLKPGADPIMREEVRKRIFYRLFGEVPDAYAHYKAASSDKEKHAALAALYDERAAAILNSHTLPEWVSKQYLARYGHDNKRKQGLDMRKLRRDDQHVDQVTKLLESANADLLEIADQGGMMYVAYTEGANDKDATNGHASSNRSEIAIMEKAFRKRPGSRLDDPLLTAEEELVHFADKQLKFTSSKAWQDACEHDVPILVSMTTKQEAFKGGLNLIEFSHESMNKDYYIRHGYPIYELASELLPDIYDIYKHYDGLVECARAPEYYRQHQPTKIDHVPVDYELIKKTFFDDAGKPRDRDEVMREQFPNMWPLFKQFLGQVAERGAQARTERLAREKEPGHAAQLERKSGDDLPPH